LIVGGGPAGAMAALALARDGTRPHLFERSSESHDVVCGGFLGWDALALLENAGIDVFALGARAVTKLHLVAGARATVVKLPAIAAGLSRRALDAVLLEQASRQGAVVLRGMAARAVEPEQRQVLFADGYIARSSALFLATGKYELRGLPREATMPSDPPVGIRVRLETTPALRRALRSRIELILFDRGYAGLVLQEDGSANLCLTVAKSRLADVEGNRERLLRELAGEAPLLGERIGAASSLTGWASIARIPYGWKTGATLPGLFRLGDQAAVIASLAGDGVAIALASGGLAARAFLSGGPGAAPQYQRDFARRAARPLWLGERLRTMAERQGLAAAAVAVTTIFPGAARMASRAVRIGAY